jgi:hypothetical protein
LVSVKYTSVHHTSAIKSSCSALGTLSVRDELALLKTAAIVYVSIAACASLLSTNCSSTIAFPYLTRIDSIVEPNDSMLC